ncbi:MAG: conjugal transfer protein TraX [Oscillospiraceae bacterium]|nr:conjugal transfer protein TraX [Oscillospiraceae bacterium]
MKISANTLKFIAITAMTLDHIALVFLPADSLLYFFMRFIGRTTAPVLTFLLVESFHHTRNRSKYIGRLFLFAAISQPAYYIMVYGRTPGSAAELLLNWNVMYTFAVSLLMLMTVESRRINVYVNVLSYVDNDEAGRKFEKDNNFKRGCDTLERAEVKDWNDALKKNLESPIAVKSNAPEVETKETMPTVGGVIRK